MLLFKYTADAEKILRTGKIKISASRDFNDPFELSPLFDCDSLTPELLRQMLTGENMIKHNYFIETEGRVSFGDYKKAYLKPRNLSLRVLKQSYDKNDCILKLNAHFSTIFDRRFRLFCGSKVSDSILMWSHYASNHEGCVLGLDLHSPPFQALREFVTDVQYEERRPAYFFSTKKKYVHKDILAVARVKHIDWSYEKEIRVMFPTTDSFCSLPSSTIRTVILGARFDRIKQEKQKALQELLNEPRYRHVEIQSASLSQDKFGIECTVLRPMS